jgi:RNA polymerase sigma factor (TIGR02999 family)
MHKAGTVWGFPQRFNFFGSDENPMDAIIRPSIAVDTAGWIDMTGSSPNEVSKLLVRWRSGDKSALEKLTPLVYEELRRLARYYMRGERVGHTLQATGLVNEAYLRLVDIREMQWQNKAHFFAVAATLMRRILVDHARGRNYAKRGGSRQRLSLSKADRFTKQPDIDLVALDDALMTLEGMNAQQSRIVELRFFGGLTIEETAEALGISHATVERDWAVARAWLRREIKR